MLIEKKIISNAHRELPTLTTVKLKTGLKKLYIKPTLSTSQFRGKIENLLLNLGWSKPVRISYLSRMSITSQRNEAGLCLQLGHPSLAHSDLLKLQSLYQKGKIKGAYYLLPTKIEAMSIGSGTANLDKLLVDLEIFQNSISIPLYILGLERKE